MSAHSGQRNGDRHEGRRPEPAHRFVLGRWVMWVVVAEGIGFLAPTAGFGLSWLLGLDRWARYGTMIVAGVIEGLCLGLGQAHALRGTPGQVPRLPWVAATAAAAGVAWSIGMLPPTLSDVGVALDLGQPVTWVLIGLGGVMLLASIPTAQWVVLRSVIRRAWRWIPLNMVAWLVGLIFTFAPGPFIDQTSPPVLIASLYAAAGMAMGASVATLTGLGLRRMLHPTGAD